MAGEVVDGDVQDDVQRTVLAGVQLLLLVLLAATRHRLGRVRVHRGVLLVLAKQVLFHVHEVSVG